MTEKNKSNQTEVSKTGHIYDGIEELDHPSPHWFMILFYFTIFFAIVYFFYYTVGDGETLVQEYRKAKDAEEYAIYEHQGTSKATGTVTENDLKLLLNDEATRAMGANSFQTKCASCHGVQGQGGIGPNLTDEFWIHGGKMTEILKTITQGVPEKGMPPWGPILKDDELRALSIYIRSILGTHPSGAKSPQGMKTE